MPTSTARSVRPSSRRSATWHGCASPTSFRIVQHLPSQGTRFHVVPSYATLTIQDRTPGRRNDRWPSTGRAGKEPVAAGFPERPQVPKTTQQVRGVGHVWTETLSQWVAPRTPCQARASFRARVDCVRICNSCGSGGVAEWLGKGLQNPLHRFNSGPRLGSAVPCRASGA